MADPMTLADARTARLVKSSNIALELVGRSLAIVRTQELIRRAAQVDGGVLLVADRGVDVESIAREIHDRGRRPVATFVHVTCSSDPARLDAALFGDVYVIQAATLVAVFVAVISQIISDVGYTFLNPRIRFS